MKKVGSKNILVWMKQLCVELGGRGVYNKCTCIDDWPAAISNNLFNEKLIPIYTVFPYTATPSHLCTPFLLYNDSSYKSLHFYLQVLYKFPLVWMGHGKSTLLRVVNFSQIRFNSEISSCKLNKNTADSRDKNILLPCSHQSLIFSVNLILWVNS